MPRIDSNSITTRVQNLQREKLPLNNRSRIRNRHFESAALNLKLNETYRKSVSACDNVMINDVSYFSFNTIFYTTIRNRNLTAMSVRENSSIQSGHTFQNRIFLFSSPKRREVNSSAAMIDTRDIEMKPIRFQQLSIITFCSPIRVWFV